MIGFIKKSIREIFTEVEEKWENDSIIGNTAKKLHYEAKAKVIAKDKNNNYDYTTMVEVSESLLFYDGKDIKGLRVEVPGREMYLNCCEGEIIDIHFHIRIDKNGKILSNIIGEPMTVGPFYDEKFLKTP